ncbi:mitotic checkpoint serine/threonine-protein kinase BUB1-like isoform X2 [Cimex lectularius]|uniref:Mitotic checkpoint serine/threonine-protein kinase BUB1 n=1 Tax=Cimex lectularius TaxID=79782 RepID=A0A8I6RM09_CIMLE|nr:mitotic checkpoint serine/threonine-protein kinase BUB1-like isoform X2 [Cimex lectularius]
MEEEIAKKKLKLKEEIATYKGNDPLKLRYDFLVWLDTTYGKDSCSNHFNALLQDTLQVFWNSNYYSNDERFIQLLVFYTEMQPNPLEVFVKSVKKGVGVKSSQFYASWANEFCKVDNYQEADRIFNLGFSNNAAPKDVLENLYKQFLQTIGKKYLRGELTNDVNTKNLVCSKCSSQVQQNGEAPPVSTPQDYNIEDPVQCWEMNPLKVGDPDYFSCAVVYLEPKDPVKVAMYPKDLVYASEKEISLEEIKARNYLNKLDTIMAVDDIILEKKPQKEEENSNTKKDRSSHLSSTQCGDITKEAMNIIEEMWYSHGLPPGCPNKFTSSEPPAQSEPFKVYDDETPLTIRQKTNTPFTVCTEDSKSENCDPENKLKGLASIKKTQPSIPRVNVLSERKIDPTPALVERPSIASQKLNFGPMDADGRLSEKLSHASIKNNPLVGITELDDGCDDTCNTKAFAFVLPSSTPVHQKKSATSGQNASNKNDGSYIEESNDKNDRKTQQELSVILEASKERYSSSSSSNGSSNPRTPGFLARPDVQACVLFLQNPISWIVYQDLCGTQMFTYDYFPLYVPEHCLHMLFFYEVLRKTYRNINWKETLTNTFTPVAVLCEEYVTKSATKRKSYCKLFENQIKLYSDEGTKIPLLELNSAFGNLKQTKLLKSKGTRFSDFDDRTERNNTALRKQKGFKSQSYLSKDTKNSSIIKRNRDLENSGKKVEKSIRLSKQPGLENTKGKVLVEQSDNIILDIIRPLKYDNIEDPFCPKLIDSFLNQMKFPLPYQSAQYHIMKGNVPNMTKSVKIGEESYNILSELGKGAYARVVKARYGNKECALKVEKPACKWEYYIAKELQRRIVPQMRNAFMIVDAAYVYQNGSILRMNWAPYGTLLTLITEHKQKIGKMLDLFVIIHFAIEMIDIVDSLHKAKIIHGDIKPDNFVLKHLPVENETESCIQLIDFGRSIDMTLFPEGTQFKHVVTTDGFQCNEMKENKPWTYQTDLYGLAGSLHCLLVGNYMKVVKKNNEWKLMQLLPRNVRRELWDPIFHKLLNTNSSNCLPNLEEMKHRLHQELNGYGDNFVFSTNLKQLHNLMNGS